MSLLAITWQQAAHRWLPGERRHPESSSALRSASAAAMVGTPRRPSDRAAAARTAASGSARALTSAVSAVKLRDRSQRLDGRQSRLHVLVGGGLDQGRQRRPAGGPVALQGRSSRPPGIGILVLEQLGQAGHSLGGATRGHQSEGAGRTPTHERVFIFERARASGAAAAAASGPSVSRA